jgi:hypothetical protein
MSVTSSVDTKSGQVPMGIRLNRFKEACTWVLAYETTPIVIPLKNCYRALALATTFLDFQRTFFWPLLDSGGGFTSETGSFTSETGSFTSETPKP